MTFSRTRGVSRLRYFPRTCSEMPGMSSVLLQHGIINAMPLGLYISVPFCRTKCSYCNFASDVFSRTVFERYVGRVCSDIERARETAERMGGRFESAVDSIFLGGGTPTILDITQLERLFVTVSQNFAIQSNPEMTV